jgi:hypothetical protein
MRDLLRNKQSLYLCFIFIKIYFKGLKSMIIVSFFVLFNALICNKIIYFRRNYTQNVSLISMLI